MIRSFDSRLELSADGGEVVGQMFPFAQVAHIRETTAAGLEEYDEEFLPGCTARMRQVAASRGGSPSWIRLTLDHESGFDHRIGFCRSMTEQADGVYGAFRLYPDPARIDKVRSMLTESHTGLSIEFDDVGLPITGDLRRRRQINVAAVTATPVPVYATARVLAVREVDDPLTAAGTPNLDRVREMMASIALPSPVSNDQPA